MAQHQPTPVLALSSRDEHAELINRMLRQAGQAAYCQRIASIDDLAEALRRYRPHLLFVFTPKPSADIAAVAAVCEKIAPILPIIAVGTATDENQIATAINAGARDLVSVAQPKRLLAVALRELRSFRLEKALRETLVSANQYRRELKAVMAGSVEAIAYVQEGIVVSANPAWVELFGYTGPETLTGMPLMDHFDRGSQAALKGALIACARKQWTTDMLRVAAINKEGSALPVELKLEEAEFGDEPAVRLSVPNDQPARNEPEQLVVSAVHKDPITGFYHRRQFIDLLTERLKKNPAGGVRALAYIRPDRFAEVKDEVGPLATEDVLINVAEIIRGLTQENDICGRFGGVVFTVLIERGTLRDLEAWAVNVVRIVSDQLLEINGKTLSITCTLGLSEVTTSTNRVDSLVLDAERANKRGRQRGGNQVVLAEISDESTRIRRLDELWVNRIKAALMDNRFRLVHMPLAHLNAQPRIMFDTVMRMVDEQGDEVAAAEFISAAERNGLLKTIDRWVISSSFAFCREQKPEQLLVKLSKDSVTDSTLVDWIASQVEATQLEPGKICLQITEEHAAQYVKPLKLLLSKLEKLGIAGAIEHFGVGRNSLRLLEQLPVRFIKIDGSILQNIATNPALQEEVRLLVDAARARKIETIAERVDQASTMAVLFQLGIGYMQGHYVHEPEVVLAERA
jgi:diguanylate cyclase (GGDEF)-like protein/PAS domain S-box-containing protein